MSCKYPIFKIFILEVFSKIKQMIVFFVLLVYTINGGTYGTKRKIKNFS